MDKQFTLSKQETYYDEGKLYNDGGDILAIKRFDEDFEQDCAIYINGKMINPCSYCKHYLKSKNPCLGNMKCLAFSRYFEEIEDFYLGIENDNE